MNKTELELLYDLIQTKPGAMARISEQLDEAELTGLFKKLPAERTTELFRAVLPHMQTTILAQMSSEHIQVWLDEMNNNHLAALVRHSDDKAKEKIIKALAPKRKAIIESLIHYPSATIGAWMSPSIVQVSTEYSCEHAYKKTLNLPNHHGWILLAGKSQQLEGKVRVDTLFKERNATNPVKDLMKEIKVVLPAKLSLNQALKHPCWQMEDWMPVIDINGRFVGTITDKQLKRALKQQKKDQKPIPTSAELGSWYGENLFEFAQLLTTPIPEKKP